MHNCFREKIASWLVLCSSKDSLWGVYASVHLITPTAQCFFLFLWFVVVLHRKISQHQSLRQICKRAVTVCVYVRIKWLPELLWSLYAACHGADFCVLLGFKQVLTGWLSYGCFPLTYCKCSLFLLLCHSLLPLHPFFLSSLFFSELGYRWVVFQR